MLIAVLSIGDSDTPTPLVFFSSLSPPPVPGLASSIEYLTGTKDQVAKAAKAYRVYFSKTEEHEEGEDYLLDHSIVIYLLAPNGDFLDFFTQRTTVSDASRNVRYDGVAPTVAAPTGPAVVNCGGGAAAVS